MQIVDFEYFDLFCTNVFGVKDSFTLQEYSLAHFIKSNPDYFNTLDSMEKVAVEFLKWQNVPFPELPFLFDNGFEKNIISNYSHSNDFTWLSCIQTLKENARRVFLFKPELPETKEEYEKRMMKEDYVKLSSSGMDSVFEERNEDVR